MQSIVLFIIILGIVVGVMTLFLLRSYLIPRRIAALAPMIADGRVTTAIGTAKRMLGRDPRNGDLHYLVGPAYLKERCDELVARDFLAARYEKTRRLEDAVLQWEKIHSKNAEYRDVAEKLSQYQSLRTDDHIKDYLTASAAEFQELLNQTSY